MTQITWEIKFPFEKMMETRLSQIAKKNCFLFKQGGDPFKPNSQKKDFFFWLKRVSFRYLSIYKVR